MQAIAFTFAARVFFFVSDFSLHMNHLEGTKPKISDISTGCKNEKTGFI